MKAFEKDNSINLLASLEKFDSEKNYKGKSDIFSKRTIKPHKAVDKVDIFLLKLLRNDLLGE